MAPSTILTSETQGDDEILHISATGSATLDKAQSKTDEQLDCAQSTNGTSLKDAIDVDLVQKHFPVLRGETVPFNNANGTLVLKEAIESASKLMYSMPIDHGDGDPRSLQAIAAYRSNWDQCAAFINASPDEITFGSSTTTLFRLLGHALRPLLNSDCEIVCSTLCHEASAGAWVHLAKDLGITIKWWSPPSDHGDSPCLSLETLQPLLSPKTRIVTCNHVSNVVGTIHPIRKVADMVHMIPGCMLIVDGVAWTPHRPTDVKALDVDFYCFSWYKVFGPHISQLYARRQAQDRYMTSINHYFLDSFPLNQKLRLGATTYELEEMCPPIVSYLQNTIGWDTIIEQETVLTRTFLDYLLSRPDTYRVFGEHSADPRKRVSIVIFEVRGRESSEIVMQIHCRNRFRIAWGDCWAPRPTFDLLKPESDGIMRVSFVHYNTVSQVKELCDELDHIISSDDSTGKVHEEKDTNGNAHH